MSEAPPSAKASTTAVTSWVGLSIERVLPTSVRACHFAVLAPADGGRSDLSETGDDGRLDGSGHQGPRWRVLGSRAMIWRVLSVASGAVPVVSRSQVERKRSSFIVPAPAGS